MSIIWEIKITPIDVPKRIVGIIAIATDNVSGRIYTVNLVNADISTTAKKIEVLSTIWSKYLKKLAEQVLLDSITGEISSLESAAKANLEGRTP